MPPSRGDWWVRRDVGRVLARARSMSGKPITVDELRYLRMWCLGLLTGPLELDAADAHQLRTLLRSLEDAQVAEREDGAS
jgi:hypothetical protein